MGRTPCCEKVGLKKGPWTPEEDKKLLAYIDEHGYGSWRALPAKAGLQRCGKSCRLRWTNYLRPDIKRGKFSVEEGQTIIQLHALLGNRWSAIATHLPKRTDNEIKNYWNTHLKKKLTKMGIDPVTHKTKDDALLFSDSQSKNAANLSHIAQWESARLDAEARLVKLRSQHKLSSSEFPTCSSDSGQVPTKPATAPPRKYHSIDVLRASRARGIGCNFESPTPTLTPSDKCPPIMSTSSYGESTRHIIEFVGTSSTTSEVGMCMEDQGEQAWTGIRNLSNDSQYKDGTGNSTCLASNIHDKALTKEGSCGTSECQKAGIEHVDNEIAAVDEGFTGLLLNDSDDQSFPDGGRDSNYGGNEGGRHAGYENSKNYWNSILHLVDSYPSKSPMF